MTFNSDKEKKEYVDKMSGLLLAKIEIMKVIEKHIDNNKDNVDNLVSVIDFYKDCDKALLSVEEKVEKDYRYREEQTSNANAAFFANKVYNINPTLIEKATVQKSKVSR